MRYRFIIPIILIILALLSLNSKHFKTYNVQKYDIIGDGNTDNTQAIQTLFDTINTDNATVQFPKGTYIISAPIVITRPVTIIGENATLKLSPQFKSNKMGQGFFYANSIDNITINNLNFDGNKSNLLKDPVNNFVTWFENTSHVTIENCSVTNLNGGGENLNTAFGFIGNSDYGKALGNTVTNSGGGAVFFQGKHSEAKNNNSTKLDDVALVANSTGAQNIIFKNNTVSDTKSGGIGIENGPSEITITDNTINNFTDGYGIGVLHFKDLSSPPPKKITIKNNKINANLGNNPCNAIAIERGENILIEKNSIQNVNNSSPHNNSIWISNMVKTTKISSNTLSKTTAHAMLIQSTESIVLSKNHINTEDVGVFITLDHIKTNKTLTVSNNIITAKKAIYTESTNDAIQLINNTITEV
ncbi:glycosyl hydrolase family 28-related protein [Bacillus cereus]|uniref:glycosyl hydrolase family 28-related protein n=1 Tax=Bacillus cereus TaxID=1396 RepID=UPI0013D3B37B|nr:glycosyl hydrolase family 28-related protein [Bacillus cereus]MDA2378790.1 glycosyl hydrolase family 28-related protein [Bacillus cereus]